MRVIPWRNYFSCPPHQPRPESNPSRSWCLSRLFCPSPVRHVCQVSDMTEVVNMTDGCSKCKKKMIRKYKKGKIVLLEIPIVNSQQISQKAMRCGTKIQVDGTNLGLECVSVHVRMWWREETKQILTWKKLTVANLVLVCSTRFVPSPLTKVCWKGNRLDLWGIPLSLRENCSQAHCLHVWKLCIGT